MKRRRDIADTVSWMAGVASVLVAAALPAAYMAVGYNSLDASIRTEAEINGRLINGIVSAAPGLWRYETVRMGDLLSRRPDAGSREARRVLDDSGNVVAERDDGLSPPLIVRSRPLMDFGRRVGTLEIRRSLRPLLYGAGLFGLLGAFLGATVFYVLRVLPIAALREALDQLAREKERAQVTLSSVAESVVTTDLHGNVEFLNPAAEAMTGWSLEAARGEPVEEVCRIATGEAPVAGGDLLRPREGSMRGGGNSRLISRCGDARSVEYSVAPILCAGGESAGTVLVLRDVTEKLRTEEELLKVKKLESVGILAGGIAHDFNNLLTAILGNIALARLAIPADHVACERLGEAEEASNRAAELATKLLTFSKGGQPIRKRVGLGEILHDSSTLAVRGTGADCAFEIPAGLWTAMADGGQIGQVIHNIVLNAAQAMPQGGRIRIRAENLTLRERQIPHLRAGAWIRIDIEDRGNGIPKENLARIFDPYFTTKEKGSGLGLATSYQIMKSHGGTILVDSEPGVGAVFHLYLPASGISELPPARKKREDAVRGRGRVLVMDDEEIVLKVVSGMLEHLGYEPLRAKDGSEAIEMYARADTEGNPVDLVIMDLTVPGGMGGKEAVGRLLEHYPEARVVVSSGYSEDSVMSKWRDYGFVGVAAKPFKLEELSRVVREAMRMPHPALSDT